MKYLRLPVVALILCHFGISSAIEWKGDFRYREEYKDDDGNTSNRNRIRLRIKATAPVNDFIEVGTQLATGNSSDPVSTNQSLGEAQGRLSIGLNEAYAAIKPIEGLEFILGRSEVPFYRPGKSEMLWDADFTGQGLGIKSLLKGEMLSPYANLAAYWVQDRVLDDEADDAMLYAAQVGTSIQASTLIGFNVGAGYYDYQNVEKDSVLFKERTPIAIDYNLIEAYMALQLGLPIPVELFGHVTNNIAADTVNMGWTAGISAGKLKDPGSWNLWLGYREVELDAVFPYYADSDWGGGKSDYKGLKATATVQVLSGTTFGLACFLNQKDLKSEKDYSVYQADLVYKF